MLGRNRRLRIACLVALMAGWAWAGNLCAQDDPTVGAPVSLQACQIAYGDATSEVELTWTNIQSYVAIEILDGDTIVTTVDGAAQSAALDGLSVGTHDFGVRGTVDDVVSDTTVVAFEVLDASPVTEPVANLVCELYVEGGGTLYLEWELGADEWLSGALEVDGSEVAAFDGGTSLMVEGLGGEPGDVALYFKNAAGYRSEALTPDCPVRVPVFRRGDCDDDGVVTISDPIVELRHLFMGGRRFYCDDACDANDDGAIDLTDAIVILQYLFGGGAPPGAPGVDVCGPDVEPDHLGGVCRCPAA